MVRSEALASEIMKNVIFQFLQGSENPHFPPPAKENHQKFFHYPD